MINKIENLENPIKIKWAEKIENIIPKTIKTPDYTYWKSQNTLDYNIAVRNKPTIWKTKTLIFERYIMAIDCP
jgi:hypothetical protein